jgi:FixJ family two-component response regulator
MRRSKFFASIWVIFLQFSHCINDRRLQTGVASFLGKPVSKENLLNVFFQRLKAQRTTNRKNRYDCYHG